MPKVEPRRSGRAKAATKAAEPTSKPPSKAAKASKATKDSKAAKGTHLYTDDNPKTTIEGTGFKDAVAAKKTLTLISKRSLIYQFQTVNTMFNRAKNHPHPTPDIEAAMAVFRTWLDEIYPAEKAALRENEGFKPLVPKKVVQKYLPKMKEKKVDMKFADLYTELEPRKKLGNVLVDPDKPAEKDWEVVRYDELCKLVPEKGLTEDELWDGPKEPSKKHLQLMAWAWSPVDARKL